MDQDHWVRPPRDGRDVKVAPPWARDEAQESAMDDNRSTRERVTTRNLARVRVVPTSHWGAPTLSLC